MVKNPEENNVCHPILLEHLHKMKGCRLGAENSNGDRNCFECLPGFKQVDSDENGWCHTAGTNTTLTLRKNVDDYTTQDYASIGLEFDLKSDTRFYLVNSLNLDKEYKEVRPFELYISSD